MAGPVTTSWWAIGGTYRRSQGCPWAGRLLLLPLNLGSVEKVSTLSGKAVEEGVLGPPQVHTALSTPSLPLCTDCTPLLHHSLVYTDTIPQLGTPRDHPSACLDACPPHMHVTTVCVYAVSPVYTSTLALALVHFTLKARQWQLSPCTAHTASHGSCGEFRAHRPPAPAHPPAPCDQCGAAPRSTVVGGGPEGSETHGPLVPDVQERPR